MLPYTLNCEEPRKMLLKMRADLVMYCFYARGMDWQIIWTVFGAGIGGALLGGLTSVSVAMINNRHQRKLWLMDQKVGVYTEVLERFSKTPYWEATSPVEPDVESFFRHIDLKVAKVKLLGAREVAEKIYDCASEEYALAVLKTEGSSVSYTKFNRLLEELETAITADLTK